MEELAQVTSRSGVQHVGPDAVSFTLILCYLSDTLPVYQVSHSIARQKYLP